MKPLHYFTDQLTDTNMLLELTDLLRRKDQSFRIVEQEFAAAVQEARCVLASEDFVNLDHYIATWNQKIVCWLVYSGHLGYRVNLENFRDPTGYDFLSSDPSVYLKEHIAAILPIYTKACEEHEEYYRALSQKGKAFDGAISNYYCYLETVGPKLAHYAGYVIANEFLPWVEPGYYPDLYQTLTYTSHIEKYLGFHPFPETIL